nr:MAG TPA: STRUCTURAL MAINTENANCE OF CHROMOSOMES PROTEIN [Caudoviricetes sp.]
MGFFDVFKGKQYKKELEELKKSKMSIEQMDAFELQQSIIDKKKELDELNSNVEKLSTEKKTLADKLNELSQKIDNANSTIEMQEYGLYEPKYDFATSLGYKEKLTEIRKNQKEMIRKKVAVDYREDWTVDGSKAKGTKMTNDSIKLVLRAFNNECEAAINKVKYSNYDSIQKRIERSYEQINKLTSVTQVSISYYYLDSKLEELALAYEYAKKKEQEKEELREQRQREREEKALQKEVAQKKKVIDKEINHFKNVIAELQEKLKSITDDNEATAINKQLSELEQKIGERDHEKEELDYRTANASAGYVYIISNIGSFGKDVFKIGVTRRLDPTERISELSSASVPFKFDIHALIFSYDAYKLETELHNYFDNYKINKVNNHKEFYKIPIEKIKEKLAEYKELTIDFEEMADAEEYRQTLAIENNDK